MAQEGHVPVEGEELADAHRSVENEHRPLGDDEDGEQHGHCGAGRRQKGGSRGDLDRGGPRPLRLGPVGARIRVLPSDPAQDAQPLHGVGGDRRQLPLLVAHRRLAGFEGPSERHEPDDEDRHPDEDDEPERERCSQHEDRDEDGRRSRGREFGDEGRRPAQCGGVGVRRGDDVARRRVALDGARVHGCVGDDRPGRADGRPHPRGDLRHLREGVPRCDEDDDEQEHSPGDREFGGRPRRQGGVEGAAHRPGDEGGGDCAQGGRRDPQQEGGYAPAQEFTGESRSDAGKRPGGPPQGLPRGDPMPRGGTERGQRDARIRGRAREGVSHVGTVLSSRRGRLHEDP